MTKLCVANWKMQGNLTQIVAAFNYYQNHVEINKTNIVIAPPNIYLSTIKLLTTDKNNPIKFKIGAQDLSRFANNGAYTGEISGAMLQELGIDYVIIGHSERRELLLETDTILLAKIKNCRHNNMIPIFCIGENLLVRENKQYLTFLQIQLDLLTQVNDLNQIIVAYEPIWAIGSGVTPTLGEIDQVTDFILEYMQKILPCVKITILYGGSVNSKNAQSILTIKNLGGVLIGSAALNNQEFLTICSYA